ncbi:MAG: hypothetical protein ACD_78C00042G0004 [uncultured bacterium (gcode 4)]|uniref:Uncharacterized protein n=1 Tax=uncultured bacterium (gcode 4) TaxID=1234023 RepID=K1XZ85_9BACT|nr:MAG: hypothetical protein ACD_78C00042G0004 [uncultured bacterium (gcode 4)]
MKTLSLWKKSLYSAFIFFGTLVVLSVGYGAYSTMIPVTGGQPLTMGIWNAMILNIDDLNTRVNTLTSGASALWNNVTGGTAYMGGKVGIGTTTPNTLLHVYDTGANAEIDIQSVAWANNHWGIYNDRTDNSLKFWNNTITGEKNAVTMLSNGNVGIGTSSPSGMLDIASGWISLVLGADNAAFSRTNLTAKTSRIGSYHYINAEKPVGLIMGSSDATNSYVGIGGNTSIMNAPTVINFFTAANTTTIYGTERMRIDSTGNVGIGTTDPSAKLDVNGSIAENGGLLSDRYTNRFTFFLGWDTLWYKLAEITSSNYAIISSTHNAYPNIYLVTYSMYPEATSSIQPNVRIIWGYDYAPSNVEFRRVYENNKYYLEMRGVFTYAKNIEISGNGLKSLN